MTDLANRRCGPCNAETAPIEGKELQTYREHLHSRWRVIEDHHLAARYDFKDFAQALEFTNRVGSLAEAEGHHPEICLSWGWVKVRIWTHAIDGLSENDFILAAKMDQMDAASSEDGTD